MDKKKKNRIIVLAAVTMTAMAVCLYEPSLVACASGGNGNNMDQVTAKFNTLKDIVTAIVSGVGVIVTLWGISEWGMAFQGQDGTMQAHSFKRIAGGLIMILAPQILSILTS